MTTSRKTPSSISTKAFSDETRVRVSPKPPTPKKSITAQVAFAEPQTKQNNFSGEDEITADTSLDKFLLASDGVSIPLRQTPSEAKSHLILARL
ncbi:hypothetical protein DP73_06410 [Desulfosporosinus sp. HMP52]|uniref:hypothetical protein n=1 Tax=Desulfosporosinus sp. HMP52 TaxID=1487923 RepID=UPI00051FE866|nr:hypothetical protein [Desulfosporosinus sp. HMP52]KGK90876.1 hypothetical protein DP73_06410 [Desulfosporosinus sp. HMP52]